MDDPIRQFLFRDDLPPEERRALLDDALDEDEDVTRALRRWHAARQRVAGRFRQDLPERRLLVLYALAEEDPSDVLSEAEQRELADARPQIEAALEDHPALEDVVEQIRRERDAFENAWNEHTGTATDAPAPRSEHAGSRRAADRTASAPDTDAGPKRRLVQRWGFRVAATLALVAFGAVLFFVAQRDWSTVTVTVAEGEEPRLVELADGSTVRLMPGGTLSYIDPGAEAALDRQATLESGRAFFDIVDQQEGFVIETPTAQVTVLGTRFGVRAEERATRVVLAEGRVALASSGGGAPVTLRPGQASRVAAGARPATPTEVESLSEALAWTGKFFFRSTPAEEIADRLASHYGQTVRVAPPLAEQEVTGTFDRDRPLRETLQTIAAALDAQLTPVPDGYLLAPASGGP